MTVFAYQNESGFSKFLIVLLVMSALLNGAAVGSSVMVYEMLLSVQNGADVPEEEAEAHDTRQIGVGLLQLASSIFIGIIFLMWVYRMSRNAHAIENAKLEYSPGWAVGWYFIPIVNIWKPYQAMKETYQAFINREHIGMVLPVWWFAWLLANAMGRIDARYALKTDTLDQLLTGTQLTIIADSCAVFLDVVAIMMVVTVSRACAERFDVDHFEAATQEWE